MIQDNRVIPFNKPFATGEEFKYIIDAHARGKLSGDGHYTKLCSEWLESSFGVRRALLTHSCTAALEMAALLADIKPGDEIIMPSYTFVSTANAFVLRGGVPVFVDIKLEDQNIDESKIEEAITSKTKAIVVVHYAGVACEMDTIMRIALENQLIVIEDAAQAIFSTYKGRQLGTIGDLGCFSFHETKNIGSGEGGALLVNKTEYLERAEIIREKGTDRSRFFRGQVDKYTWQDVGSSFLPSELNAAYLWAQLQAGVQITKMRKGIWGEYKKVLVAHSLDKMVSLPLNDPNGNGHMFQIVFPTEILLSRVHRYLLEKSVNAVTHYVPLHSSPGGKMFGKTSGLALPNTDAVASRLLRMPLYPELAQEQDYVLEHLVESLVREV
jgi:dTDP-4-amino-4,6-dideoxygalactose transaminase